jgi:hypothetical protein
MLLDQHSVVAILSLSRTDLKPDVVDISDAAPSDATSGRYD